MVQSGERQSAHIGWDLWQAAAAWKNRFTREMVVRGHDWYGEARGALLQFLQREGIRQNDLTKLSGMTKQAVQQHLDELEKDGIVTRESDPADKRKKRVELTQKGLRAVQDAAAIKIQIEDLYAENLGRDALNDLKNGLRTLIDLEA